MNAVQSHAMVPRYLLSVNCRARAAFKLSGLQATGRAWCRVWGSAGSAQRWGRQAAWWDCRSPRSRLIWL